MFCTVVWYTPSDVFAFIIVSPVLLLEAVRRTARFVILWLLYELIRQHNQVLIFIKATCFDPRGSSSGYIHLKAVYTACCEYWDLILQIYFIIKICVKILVKIKLKANDDRDHLEGPVVDGRITWRWIFRTWVGGGHGLDSSGNAVINLRVPQNAGNFLSSWILVSLSGRAPLHE